MFAANFSTQAPAARTAYFTHAPAVPAKDGRSFRFLTADPRHVFDLGCALSVSVTDGRKFDVYHLQPCERGWRLTKQLPDGERGPEYVVDTTFGPNPAKHWECQCKGFEFRARRDFRPCRHIDLVAAVELQLGLKEEVTRG